MYVIHPVWFLSISTLHLTPLGNDGLAVNQAHLTGSFEELGELASPRQMGQKQKLKKHSNT